MFARAALRMPQIVFAVPTLRYSERMPEVVTSVPGLYLAGSAQLPFSPLNVNDTPAGTLIVTGVS